MSRKVYQIIMEHCLLRNMVTLQKDHQGNEFRNGTAEEKGPGQTVDVEKAKTWLQEEVETV